MEAFPARLHGQPDRQGLPAQGEAAAEAAVEDHLAASGTHASGARSSPPGSWRRGLDAAARAAITRLGEASGDVNRTTLRAACGQQTKRQKPRRADDRRRTAGFGHDEDDDAVMMATPAEEDHRGLRRRFRPSPKVIAGSLGDIAGLEVAETALKGSRRGCRWPATAARRARRRRYLVGPTGAGPATSTAPPEQCDQRQKSRARRASRPPR